MDNVSPLAVGLVYKCVKTQSSYNNLKLTTALQRMRSTMSSDLHVKVVPVLIHRHSFAS